MATTVYTDLKGALNAFERQVVSKLHVSQKDFDSQNATLTKAIQDEAARAAKAEANAITTAEADAKIASAKTEVEAGYAEADTTTLNSAKAYADQVAPNYSGAMLTLKNILDGTTNGLIKVSGGENNSSRVIELVTINSDTFFSYNATTGTLTIIDNVK